MRRRPRGPARGWSPSRSGPPVRTADSTSPSLRDRRPRRRLRNSGGAIAATDRSFLRLGSGPTARWLGNTSRRLRGTGAIHYVGLISPQVSRGLTVIHLRETDHCQRLFAGVVPEECRTETCTVDAFLM